MSLEITINTRGAYLHVKDALFEVRFKNETTQLEEKKQIPPLKIRTLVLAPGTALSTDAVQLALKNHIDIVFVEPNGHPMGRVWHTQLGSTSKIAKQQLAHALDARAIQWVKKWIDTKLSNQRDFIQDLKKHRVEQHDFFNTKIAQIESLMVLITGLQGEKMRDIADTLRGYEGTAGRFYWESLSHALPKDHQFSGRSARPAADPFNAFLNYGYGILYRRVEKALVIAGLQPYIGFFHRDDYNHKSMVYDFIEPYRIWIEVAIFRLFSGKKVYVTHTESIPNGIGLTALGKEVIAKQITDYLDVDAIKHQGKNQHRSHILQLDAHHFANQLLNQSK
jgi:CRISP-associated protein Cas1